jgi:hypothetical protein
MARDGNPLAVAGDATQLGPLGHLPPPNPSLDSRQSPTIAHSTTLLAPTSIRDTITDVSLFIPIVLDLAAHNNYHWRHLFVVHLGRCGLRDHINLSKPAFPSNLGKR